MHHTGHHQSDEAGPQQGDITVVVGPRCQHGNYFGVGALFSLVHDVTLTLGTLSASDGPAVRLGFSKLPGDFVKVPFGDLKALDQVQQAHGPRVVAILMEPIQGESGVQLAPPGYLKAVRELCHRRGWLMMLDEIQTGIGRTGQWFAFQHEGIVPDVMTLAKGLGNGIPIGACLARGKAAELFTPGSHGSTFGGNPLACRVACTVLDIIEEQQLRENARIQGERLLERLHAELADHPNVLAIRGQGLMIGIELDGSGSEFRKRLLFEKHIFTGGAGASTVRLLPALCLTRELADRFLNAFKELVR